MGWQQGAEPFDLKLWSIMVTCKIMQARGHESKRLAAAGLGSDEISHLICTAWVRVDVIWLVVEPPLMRNMIHAG